MTTLGQTNSRDASYIVRARPVAQGAAAEAQISTKVLRQDSSHLRRKISGVVAAALVAPVRFAATVLHGPSGLASVPSSISTGPIVSTLSTFLISFLVPVTGFTVVAIVGPRTQIQIDSLR